METKTFYGFTLIELSIVLIIISLIVAGITGGKSLVHQAELQSVIKDVEAFKTAINTFRLQYDAMPGDFGDAGLYWPVDCPNIGANLCGGNDDGILDAINGADSFTYTIGDGGATDTATVNITVDPVHN